MSKDTGLLSLVNLCCGCLISLIPHEAAPSQPTVQPQPATQHSSYPTHIQPAAQEYPLVETTLKPNQHELDNIEIMIQRLWELDDNRMNDLDLHYQRYTRVGSTEDATRDPLFQSISTSIFEGKPTFRLFMTLLDNYNCTTGTHEQVTEQHKQEQMDFIQSILSTRIGGYLFEYCVAKKYIENDKTAFNRTLQQLWFGLYKRTSLNDSSAFEHTFIGEHKEGQVIGFHNWVHLFLEEKAGRLNYHGWIRPRSSKETHPHPHIVSLQFSWKDQIKPVSTFMMGTSPEFEMALYTLVYFANVQQVDCTLNQQPIVIKCHTFQNRQGKQLGSCYVESK